MTSAPLRACGTVEDWLGRQWHTLGAPREAGASPVRTEVESVPGSAGEAWVFRFTLHDAGAALPSPVYAKVFDDDRAPRLHRQLARLGAWLVHADGTLRVPALLGVDGARRCLLQAPARGEMLADLRAGAALDAALRRVGRALAQLHTVPIEAWREPALDGDLTDPGAEADSAFDRQIAALMRPHPERLALARPHLRGRIGALLDDLRALAGATAGTWQPALLHRDLHPRQLFVRADRVELIDWDLAGPGDPALDLANLLMHVEQRWPLAAPSACAALLTGYGEAAVAALAARLPLYRAFFHLRRACKAQRLGTGADLIEHRLAQAEQALDRAALAPRSAP